MKIINNSLRRTFLMRVIGVLLLAWCSGIYAGAQTNVGRISGTVKDLSEAVIPNATVTVTNINTNLARTATTDENGFYTVTNLPVGSYNVIAELKGFKKAISTGIALTADARLTVDLA